MHRILFRMVRSALLVFAALIVGACANQRSILQKFDVSKTESGSMDAKQRAILVSRVMDDGQPYVRVCAEPSPDALATFSAELAGNVKDEALSADLTSKMLDSGQVLGNRTATIQLLRDGLFRACEAYINGALDQ